MLRVCPLQLPQRHGMMTMLRWMCSNVNDKSIVCAVELRDIIMKKTDKNYTLVDVRQPHEYDDGHIPTAILLPLSDIEKALNMSPEERFKMYGKSLDTDDLIFYCHAGVRSQAATEAAHRHGLNQARNFRGSWSEWSLLPDSKFPKQR